MEIQVGIDIGLRPETAEFIANNGKMWELFPGGWLVEMDMHTLEEFEVFINKCEDIEKRHIVAKFESLRDNDGSLLFCNIKAKESIL